MRPSDPGQTLFIPTARGSIADRATTGLPPDLLNRAATRLQAMAWLYAFTFFMAAFFPALIFPDIQRQLFAHPVQWAPGVTSIAVAVVVALAIGMARLRPALVTVLALAFEVVSSYGIAAAEFLQPGLTVGPPWTGLSWVAVWMLLFNVVVPTVPRYAVIAALLSVTAVPVMVLISIGVYPPASPPTGIDDLPRIRLSVRARCHHGVRRRAGRLQPGHRGHARARAGQLRARGAPGRGRHGRSLEGESSPAGPTGGHQADPVA